MLNTEEKHLKLSDYDTGSVFVGIEFTFNWSEGDIIILIDKIAYGDNGIEVWFYNMTEKEVFHLNFENYGNFNTEIHRSQLRIIIKREVLIEKQLPYFKKKEDENEGHYEHYNKFLYKKLLRKHV